MEQMHFLDMKIYDIHFKDIKVTLKKILYKFILLEYKSESTSFKVKVWYLGQRDVVLSDFTAPH